MTWPLDAVEDNAIRACRPVAWIQDDMQRPVRGYPQAVCPTAAQATKTAAELNRTDHVGRSQGGGKPAAPDFP